MNLGNDFSHLLHSHTYSDFKIIVSGKTIFVHRAILSARSPVFNAMLNQNNMIESKTVFTVNQKLFILYFYLGYTSYL